MKKQSKRMKNEKRVGRHEDFLGSLWIKMLGDMDMFGAAFVKVSYNDKGCLSVKVVRAQEIINDKV